MSDSEIRQGKGAVTRAVTAGLAFLLMTGSLVGFTLTIAAVQAQPAAAAGTAVPAYPSTSFTKANVAVPSDWVKPARATAGTQHACLSDSANLYNAATQPIPGCSTVIATVFTGTKTTNGFLEFTKDTDTEDGGVAYTHALPSANGLDVTFDSYQYGKKTGATLGADGIGFFLAGVTPKNPTLTSPTSLKLGPTGGHLGYSAGIAAAGDPDGVGMTNGYLGVGLDVFGNYTNDDFNGNGCKNPTWATAVAAPNNVTVRGPGNKTTGYCLLSSSKADTGLIGLLTDGEQTDGTPTITKATNAAKKNESPVPVEVAINPTATAITTASHLHVPPYSYVASVTPIGGPTQTVLGTLPNDTYLTATETNWVNPTTGIPKDFILGWTGSTGGSKDIHAIKDVTVSPLIALNPPRFTQTMSTTANGVLVKTKTVNYTVSPVLSPAGGTEKTSPKETVTFPAGITPESATGGTDWHCVVAGLVVTCTWIGGTITPGEAIPSISITSMVPSTATAGVKSVSAQLTVAGTILATSKATATVEAAKAAPVLGLALSTNYGGQLEQNSTVTYTAVATVSSGGAAETDAPKFVLTVAAGETLTAASGTNWTCTKAAQKFTCTYTGTIPVGGIPAGTVLPTITLTAKMPVDASEGYTTTGTLSSANATPLSVVKTLYGSVVDIPVLIMTKTETPATGQLNSPAGTAVVYTLNVKLSTTGGREIKPPTVTDHFAKDIFATITYTTDVGWTCVTTGVEATGQTATCTYKVATIPATGFAPGAALDPIKITAAFRGGLAAGTTVDNAATVISQDAKLSTSSVYGRTGTAAADPRKPVLKVTATSPSYWPEGETYNLKITASLTASAGKTAAAAIVVATLPTGAGEKFKAVVTTTFTCALTTATRVLTCTAKTAVETPGYKYKQIVADVKGTTPGLWTTTIKMTDTTAAKPASTSATTDITKKPILAITATPATEAVAAGATYTLTISPSIKTTGGPAYHKPKMTDSLPAGETIVTGTVATGGKWTCVLTPATNATKITCTSTSTDLLAGVSLGTIKFKVKVASTATVGTHDNKPALTDTTDGAVQALGTSKITVTKPVVLKLTAPTGVPTTASVNSTYTITYAPALTAASGKTYNKPIFTVKLVTGETFTGNATVTPATWTPCVVSTASTVLTCTSTSASHTPTVKAALGTVKIKVKINATGTHTIKATLTDHLDGATAVSKTTTIKATPDPKLKVTGLAAPTQGSVGTTSTVTFSPVITTSVVTGKTYHAPILTITLPTGLTFTGAAPTTATWHCVKTARKLTCSEKTTKHTPGPLGTVTIKVKLTKPTTLTIKAALTDPSDSATTTLGHATVVISSTKTPILKITPTGIPAHAASGSTYTFIEKASLTILGGKTYHAPTMTIKLVTGETFVTGGVISAATFTCSAPTTGSTKITCTSTSATHTPSVSTALGTVKLKVKITAVGTHKILSTLTDHADAVTPAATKTNLVNATKAPTLSVTITKVPSAAPKNSTFSFTVSPKISTSGGKTYHKPVVTITLPTGETFTGTPAPATWTCVISGRTLTCTSKATSHTPTTSGTLGKITVNVKIEATAPTGTAKINAKLTATTANATPKTASTKITKTPVLTLTLSDTVATGAAVGSTYPLTIKPKLKPTPTGGKTYNKPVLTLTLPAGESFTGTAPTTASWHCVFVGKKMTCTAKSGTHAAGSSLGTLVLTIKVTATGAQKATALLTDKTDGAAAVSATSTVTVTKSPKFTLTVTGVPSTKPKNTTFTVTVNPKLATTGPTYNKPTLTISLPPGEVVTGTVTTPTTGWVCTPNAGKTKVTCTAKTPKHAKGTPLGKIKFKVKIKPTAPTGTAKLTVTLKDPSTGAVTKIVPKTTKITKTPVLTLTLSDTVATGAAVGSTYPLTIKPKLKPTPTGGKTYNKPVLTLTLPAGESFTGTAPTTASWHCVFVGKKMTCTAKSGTHAAGSSLGTLVLTIKVTATGAQKATALLTDKTDGAAAVSATSTVTVTKSPKFTLTVTGVPSTKPKNTTFTVTVNPKLATTGPTYNKPTLTISLPPGEVVTGTVTTPTTGWVCTPNAGKTKVTCTAKTPKHAKGTPLGKIKFKVKIKPTAPTGTAKLTVTLKDPSTGAVTKIVPKTTKITKTPVLTLTLSDTVATGAAVGSTYPLTIKPKLKPTPTGGKTYNKPVLTLTLPAGESFTGTAPTTASWHCVFVGKKMTCTAKSGTHAAGSSLGTLVLTIKVTATGAQKATALLTDKTDGAAAVSATSTVTVTKSPKFTLTVTGVPSTKPKNTTFTVTVNPKLATTGPTYNKPTLTISLPPGEVVTGTVTTPTTGWVCTPNAGKTKVTCTAKTPKHAKGTPLGKIKFKVKIKPTAPTGTAKLTVTLKDPSTGAVTKIVPKTTKITKTPVLTLTLSDTVATGAAVGSTYPLTIKPKLKPTPTGGKTYNKPVLTLTLPAGESFTGTAPTTASWHCVFVGKKMTCTAKSGTHAAGSSLGTLVLTIKVTATGAQKATALLTDKTDGAAAVSATSTVTVTKSPKFTLTVTGVPSTKPKNTTFTVTVNPKLATTGPTYNKPTLTISLPPGEVVTGTVTTPTTGWVCTPNAGKTKVTCTAKTPKHAKGTPLGKIKFKVKIKPTAPTGTAKLTVTLKDPSTGAVTKIVPKTTKITKTPVLTLTLSDTVATGAAVGSTYPLTIKPKLKPTPTGGKTYNKPVLTLTLPAGESFTGTAPTTASWHCVFVGKKMTCTAKSGTHAAGSSLGTLVLTIKVTATGAQKATALLTDKTDGAAAVSATSTVTVTKSPVLLLTTSGTPPTGASRNSKYTLTLTPRLSTTGGKTYHAPTLTVTLPATKGELFVSTTIVSVGTKWTCRLASTNLKLTCISKSTSHTPGTGLGKISVEVSVLQVGTFQTVANLADPSDGALTATKKVNLVVTATPVLTLSLKTAPVTASAGTTYTLVIQPALTKTTGGKTYHAPHLVVTLSPGETFTSIISDSTWSATCHILSVATKKTKLTCTSNSKIHPKGSSLGTIKVRIKITNTISKQVSITGTLSDPTDAATSVTRTVKVTVIGPPVFKLKVKTVPVSESKGTSYTMILTPSLTLTGGPTIHAPTLSATLETGLTFVGASLVTTKWTCHVVTFNLKLTCTAIAPGHAAGTTLGSIKIKVVDSLTGTLTTTIKISDLSDNAKTLTTPESVKVTADPILKVTASGEPAIGASVGTSYPLTVTPKLTALGGPTYHDSKLVVTLVSGQKFTGTAPTTAAWKCSFNATKTIMTCTTKSGTHSAGTIGPIVVTVKTTATGTDKVTTTLSDTTDLATKATTSKTLKVTKDPILDIKATGVPPLGTAVGKTYPLTVTPSLTPAGGPTYHTSTLSVTLAPGQVFTGTAPTTAAWKCSFNATKTVMTCTTKSGTHSAGTIGPIVVTVKTTATGTDKITGTISDANDLATSGTFSKTAHVTADPVLVLTASVAGTTPGSAVGTSYTLKLTPSVKKTTGPTYHDSKLVVTLVSGQKFTGTAPTTIAWKCSFNATKTIMTCTTKSGTHSAGTIGPIVVKVKTTATGTDKITGSLTDVTDLAVPGTAVVTRKVTADPILKVTASGEPAIGASVGTSYPLTVTPKLTALGGPTYHDSKLVVTLLSGQKFTGTAPTTAAWKCSFNATKTIMTCTTKSGTHSAGTIGPIVVTVKTTATGTDKVTTTLSDTTDLATKATTSKTLKVTKDPILDIKATGVPPLGTAVGKTYPLTVTPSLTPAGGPTYHTSTLSVTLAPGQVFTGTAPTTAAWKCSFNATKTVMTCTTKSGTHSAGTIGPIVVTVKTTATGTDKITGTISDANDLATSGTFSKTAHVTADPVLVLTASVAGTTPGSAVGTSYTLKLTPSVKKTTGPTYHDSKLVVTLVSGQKFTGTAPTTIAWKCSFNATKTIMTCTTKSGTHSAGTIGPIVVKVKTTATGTDKITGSLTDVTDLAVPGTAVVTRKVTADPILKVTASGEPAIGASVGTSYPLTVTPKLTALGGPTYHDSKLVVTLLSGQKFTGTAPTTAAWKCSFNATKTIMTCTTKSGTHSAGTIGPIVVTVKTTATGTDKVTTTLSDTTDLATKATTSKTLKVTKDPILDIKATGVPPLGTAVGKTYPLTVTPSLTPAGGPTYHTSTLSVTLAPGQVFTGTAPTTAAWKCSFNATKTVMTCTTKSGTHSAGTIGPIVVTVKTTATGTDKITGTISDANDLATSGTFSKTAHVTADPVLVLTASVAGTTPGSAVGTSYTLKLTPSVKKTTGPTYHDSKLVVTLVSGQKFTGTAPTTIAWKCSFNATKTIMTCTTKSGTHSAGTIGPIVVKVKTTATGTDKITGSLTDVTDLAVPGTAVVTRKVTADPILKVTASGEPAIGASVGTSYPLTVTPKLTALGGPTYHDSKLVVTLLSGQKFTGTAPTTAAWKCSFNATKTIMTCTTKSGTHSAGTIGPIVVTVKTTATGTDKVTTTLSDTTDLATKATTSKTLKVTKDPILEASITSTPPATGSSVGTSYTLVVTPSLTPTGGPTYHTSTLTVTLKPGQTITSITSSSTWLCHKTGLIVTCTTVTPSHKAGTPIGSIKLKVTTTAPGTDKVTVNAVDPTDIAKPFTGSKAFKVTSDPTLELKETEIPTSAVPVGTIYTLTLSPSLTPATGPTYHDSKLVVTLVSGQKFTGTAPTTTAWKCSFNATKTAMTCTTKSGTHSAGTSIGLIHVKVKTTGTGADRVTGTLTDTLDFAKPATLAKVVNVTAVPVLTVKLSGTPSVAAKGSTYKLTIATSITTAGGTTYHAPKLIVTLPSGEQFTGVVSINTWKCTTLTKSKLVCTGTKADHTAPSSIGTIVVKVLITSAGTLQTKAVLSDPLDFATSVTAKATVTATANPVMKLSVSDSPTEMVKGSTYTMTLDPSVSTLGGQTYNKPTLTVTLPTTEAFSGIATAPTWTKCTVSLTKEKLTCLAKTTVNAPGTNLGTISIQIKTVTSGVLTATAVLADASDGGTSTTERPSVDVTATPVLTLKVTAPTSQPLGSKYTMVLIPKVSTTGGATYSKPTLTVTLPAGEVFESPATVTPAQWTCTPPTTGNTKLICTAAKATHTPGSPLGDVTIEVGVTATGTHTATATLADHGDGSSSITRHPVIHVTPSPILQLRDTGTPTGASVGTSYTLSLTPSVTATGGPTYSKPVLVVDLPTGEKFSGTATAKTTTWSCKVTTSQTVLTCTAVTKSHKHGTALGLVTIKVTITSAGSHTSTATLSDPTDGATPTAQKRTVTATAAPTLILVTSGTPVHAAEGSTYPLTLSPSLGSSGPTYNTPHLTVTLPSGEHFGLGTITTTTWSCHYVGTTKLTCTAISATHEKGTSLGTISVPIDITKSSTGTLTATAVLSDPSDAATSTTQRPTVNSTESPKLKAVPTFALTSASKGSTDSLKVVASLTSLGGPTYNKPSLVVTLTSGLAFTGFTPTANTLTCHVVTATTLKCTALTSHIAAGNTIGTVTITVISSKTGTQSATATLSDPTDGATSVTKKASAKFTPTPILKVTVPSYPTHLAKGAKYTMTLEPKITTAGGPIHSDPLLTATLPTGEVFTNTPATKTWTCKRSSSTLKLTCTFIGTLPIGSTTPIGAIKVGVQDTTVGTMAGTATFSDAADGATPGTHKYSVDITPSPILKLTVQNVPAKAYQGSSFTVTLVPKLTIAGGTTYNKLKLTFTLPAGLEVFSSTPRSATWACGVTTLTSTVLTCTTDTDDHTAGNSIGTIKIRVTTTSTGSAADTAKLSDTADGATPKTVKDSTTITKAPVLKLTLTPLLGHASKGSDYTLIINPSMAATSGTTSNAPQVTVTLPSGEESLVKPLPTAPTWNCVVVANKITCTSKSTSQVAGSSLGSIKLDLLIGSVGTIATTVLYSDSLDGATPVTKRSVITATTTPILKLTDSGTLSKDGTGKSYTLHLTPSLTSSGGPTYNRPQLTVTLPGGESFSSAATAPTWNCHLTTGTPKVKLTCVAIKAAHTAGSLLGKITIPVKISGTGALTMTAVLSDASDGSTPATRSATVTASTEPILLLTTSTTPAKASTGTSYVLTLTPALSTKGGQTFKKPRLTVTLPAGELFSSTATSTSAWNCTPSITKSKLSCLARSTVNLAPGKLGKLTVHVKIIGTGTLTTTATLSDTTDFATPVSTKPSVIVTPTPILKLTSSGTPTKAIKGSTYTLTLSPKLTATGGPTNHQLILTVSLPTGETYTSLPTPTPTVWTCAATGSAKTKFTCKSKTTSVSAATTLGNIRVPIKINATGSLTATAVLSDPNDAATPVTTKPTVTAAPFPTLSVGTSGNPSQVFAGTSFTLTVTPKVGATGGQTYHPSTLTISLPAGETVNGTPNAPTWTCSVSTSTKKVSCVSNSGTHGPGTSLGAVKIPVSTTKSATGTLTATVTMTDVGDSASKATTTEVEPIKPPTVAPPILVLKTSGTPTTVGPGTTYTLTLTLSVTPAGGPASHGSTVTDTLPTGETFTSTPHPTGWDCTVTNSGHKLTCNYTGTLPVDPGQSFGKITAKVKIAATATGILTSHVKLTDPSDGATPVTHAPKLHVKGKAKGKERYGYRLAGADGGVFCYGPTASFRGSLVSRHIKPTSPVTAIATTPGGQGYWLVDYAGEVYGFGNARLYGSLVTSGPGGTAHQPIVGIASTHDGKGYWLVATNGGIFTFGDAQFYGDTQSQGIENRLVGAVVGITPTLDGKGYWEVASDGGVFAFGDARFYGNTYTIHLRAKISGMTMTNTGKGYWLVARDGGIFAFGKARFEGNTYTQHIESKLVGPVIGIAAPPTANSYWEGADDGGVFAFGKAPFDGNTYTQGIEDKLNGPIVGISLAP